MVYIDSEYKCHTSNQDGVYREIEIKSEYATGFFDGKCDTFIDGYRFIPIGESWTRSDGVVFKGEMIAPWKPYSELEAAQREYERQKLAEYETLIDELYAEVTAE